MKYSYVPFISFMSVNQIEKTWILREHLVIIDDERGSGRIYPED
jgi:hypothetical protein